MKLVSPNVRRKVRRATESVSPRYLSHALRTRRLIQDFADTHGLVYFGYVNYRTDEHRLVRGMTTATNQEDTHYCIGSFNAYDVVFVRRQSTVATPSKLGQKNWLILQIDLRTKLDIPHVFIGPKPGREPQYDEITSALHSFQPITPGVFGAHDPLFTNAYTIYTKPSRNVDAERIFTPDITKEMASHFSPLTIEVWDDCLFVYSTQRRPTAQLLDAMLRNGVWLAEKIDERCQVLVDENSLLERAVEKHNRVV